MKTRKPEATYIVGGRNTVRFPYTGNSDAMDGFIERMGVDYVLLDSCYAEVEEYVLPYVLARPNRFSVVLNDENGTIILKVLDGKET